VKFTADEFLAKLPQAANEKWPEGVRDVEAFRQGEVSLVLFEDISDDLTAWAVFF